MDVRNILLCAGFIQMQQIDIYFSYLYCFKKYNLFVVCIKLFIELK